MLDGIAQRNAELMAKVAKPDISVTLPNGAQCPGQAYVTTPLDIATSISKGLAQAVVVASVKYSKRYEGVATIVDVAMGDEDEAEEVDAEWESWDATRPLEGDCQLQLLKFDEPQGKEAFWHSSAHILGQALESTLRRAPHARPADRRRLLLRLVHGRSSRVGGHEGGPREEGQGDHRREAALRARRRDQGGVPRALQGQPVQARHDQGQAARRLVDDRLPQRPLRRPVQGAAPAHHREGQGLRDDEDVVGAVAGQAGERRAAARATASRSATRRSSPSGRRCRRRRRSATTASSARTRSCSSSTSSRPARASSCRTARASTTS